MRAVNYLTQKQVKDPRAINAKENLQEASKLIYHLFFAKSVTFSYIFCLYSKYVEYLHGVLDFDTFRNERRLLSKSKLSDAIDLSRKTEFFSWLNLFSILDYIWWYVSAWVQVVVPILACQLESIKNQVLYCLPFRLSWQVD